MKMAYKPILFNTEMVKAILEGRKTQTRRIVKPKCRENEAGFQVITNAHSGQFVRVEYIDEYENVSRYMEPPCAPGDILWVRETCHKDVGRYMYRANYTDDERFFRNGKEVQIRWTPSIHMPREAARIFLRVKDVRVERLQNITEQDAISEGITRLFDHLTNADYEEWANRMGYNEKQSEWPWKNYLWHGNFGSCGMGNRLSDAWPYQFSAYKNPRDSFSSLWNSVVRLKEWDMYGWNANPWVWVIEFERVNEA